MSLQAKNCVTNENFTIFGNGNIRGKVMIVVSKKVAPKAVDRNRIKRLIKESLRLMGQEKSLKVIVKKNVADAKMIQIKGELTALLK